MWQKIKNYYHLLGALLASLYFGFPSRELEIVGVTGTDGKSTTATMIYQILKDSGKKAAVLTSIGAYIGAKIYETGDHVTTPDPFDLQRILKMARDQKIRYFIVEATSHGLDQNRLSFVNFKIGVITNVASEHLDYHQSWQNYLKAKLKLFKNVQFSILNSSDKSYEFLKDKVNGKVLTFGHGKNADFNPGNFPIKLKIFGEYNLENALAAAACATALGVDKKIVLKSLAKFSGVVGRMQKVSWGQDFRVYIDFAHTPNALEKAGNYLKLISKANGGRLIIVFGAGGERDSLKRPQMGKIAANLADLVILTAEDPRSEKVEDIASQIATGLLAEGKRENKDFFIIPQRKLAIIYAVKIARKKDVVAFFGKGHEKGMSFQDKNVAWDEFKIVKEALLAKIQK